jgi:hypothetical protein
MVRRQYFNRHSILIFLSSWVNYNSDFSWQYSWSVGHKYIQTIACFLNHEQRTLYVSARKPLGPCSHKSCQSGLSYIFKVYRTSSKDKTVNFFPCLADNRGTDISKNTTHLLYSDPICKHLKSRHSLFPFVLVRTHLPTPTLNRTAVELFSAQLDVLPFSS